MSNDFDPIWTSLLAWLATFEGSIDIEEHVQLVHNAAGRGLVARIDLKPSSLLISIPNKALLNLSTLSPLYPPPFTNGRLNATQLLSLHLALQFRKHLFSDSDIRVKGKSKESPAVLARDKYWPFIATLPRSFPNHPLTWKISTLDSAQLATEYSLKEDVSMQDRTEMNTKERSRYQKLCDCMGSGLRSRVNDIGKRFKQDWETVQSLWNETKLEEGEVFGFYDFLLGWLNVNTRCIYFDLPSNSTSPSHWSKKENSLTLAPVIDMINHAPALSTKPHPSPTALTFSSPSRSSSDKELQKGDELAFSYGGHDDSFLLSEYGFTVGDENPYNSLDCDKYIEGMFENQGLEGELKIGVLKDSGYWGDMTFQSHPPAPSWRVLIALRLFHLRLPSNRSLSAEAVAPFYDLLSGSIDQISHLNEKKVEATLKAIAKSLVIECGQGIKTCQTLRLEWEKEQASRIDSKSKEERGHLEEMLEWLGMIEGIWKGEEKIAKAVAEEGNQPVEN
ncbi:protein-lysine N-methyltransferase [Sporobolomyces salmoneus]|uniref:protein-lysine N-methyltransferase n=1 Tax=Sporobolomyces salmoneus TaxID=183962 RepID=UPI00318020F8